MGTGKRIEAAMIKAGKKPVDIARHFKITESAVSQWFKKDSGPKSARLSDLADFLQTTVDELMREEEPTQASLFPSLGVPQRPSTAQPAVSATDLSKPDIPVWASVAGGDGDGAILLMGEPIDYIRRSERTATVRDPWAFHVVGESMLERLVQGDQVVINPALPLLPLTDCVFIHQAEDGTMYALVKRLLRANAEVWRVRQLNPPKDFDLSRKKWTKAFRIAEIRPRM
mgnify:CR=1